MKKRIIRYFVHIFSTILVLLIVGSAIIISENGALHYGDDSEKMNWENDGPYVFVENDSTLKVQYIKGNQDDGFHTSTSVYPADSTFSASSFSIWMIKVSIFMLI